MENEEIELFERFERFANQHHTLRAMALVAKKGEGFFSDGKRNGVSAHSKAVMYYFTKDEFFLDSPEVRSALDELKYEQTRSIDQWRAEHVAQKSEKKELFASLFLFLGRRWSGCAMAEPEIRLDLAQAEYLNDILEFAAKALEDLEEIPQDKKIDLRSVLQESVRRLKNTTSVVFTRNPQKAREDLGIRKKN